MNEPTWPTKLGALVRASGMTVLELCAETEQSNRWAVADHLNGRRRPSPALVARYCLALNCDPEDIIE